MDKGHHQLSAILILGLVFIHLSALIPTARADAAFQQDASTQHIVSMEAEHYQNSASAADGHQWQQVSDAIYADSAAMQALPEDRINTDTNYTTTGARLDFEVNFTATGTHYVWVRGLGPGTSSDSLHVGIDGAGPASGENVNRFYPTGSLVWSGVSGSSLRTLEVPAAGLHTINVWMRESGMVFDKLVLTTDPNFVPAGSGPGESAQGGNSLPVLDPIGDRSVDEGSTLNFTVTASDPDATTPVLGATNLPAGASFTDNLDGTGTFSWATASGDAGAYPNITFTATDALDNALTDSETITITVGGGSQSTVWPTDGWQTATPQQEGLDPVLLAQARDYALAAGGSGYIIKNGKLVMSWGSASQLYDVKSATKSIGSAALGLAIRDGLVQLSNSAQSHFSEFGTPPATNTATGWLGDITLFQLGTQTAGFDKTGGYCDLLFEPGTVWAYSDGGINWLADVLTVANGMDLNAVMFSRVFTPLGITPADLSWRQNAYRTTTINGIERREMGSGISINVDAMARIGYLYLHQGRWDAVQIIPSDFVAAVGTSHGNVATLSVANNLDSKYENASRHYGLMWWTNSDGAMAAVPRDAFWAWGLGDNVILVIPSLDIVVSRAGPEFPVSHSPDFYTALEPFFEPIALADGSNPTPTLDPIGDRTVDAGSTLSFTVTASDPDATTPVLGATNLPAGASFTDHLDGTGTFSWATATGDAGTYPNITFTATDALDNALTDSETITITVNPVIGTGGAFQQDSTAQHIVSMEAEHYQNSAPATDGHQWQQVSDAIYAGSAAMQALPEDSINTDTNYTTTGARLDFEVNFTATGTHYVWVRGLGPSTSSDSLHVGIDGTGPSSGENVNKFYPTGSLVWSGVSGSSVRTLEVPAAGLHTINVWMRESGMVFDKFVLTTDPNFVPAGSGPGENSGSTYFFDDFSADTIADYTVIDTQTSGGFGVFLYDAAAERAELLTGQNVGSKFLRNLSGIDSGAFKAEFLPTQGYNGGGTFSLRLKQDNDTYYEISNTEAGGAGIVRKVVQGQEVDSLALQSGFSQGMNYHLLVNFSPTECKVIAFGEIITLAADTTSIQVNSFEIELLQQDGFFDNIEYTGSPFDYYVAAGDSITRGSHDNIGSDGTGYEPILENLLADIKGYSHLIVNEGVSGDTSTGGVSLMPTLLADNPQARFFLVQYGSNDAAIPALPSGLGLQPGDGGYTGTFKKNMQDIIAMIVDAGKVPYLAKVPNTTRVDRDLIAIQEYNQVIDELVESNHIGVIPPDFYCYFENHPELLDDGLHPNGLGYQAMAQIWSDVLTDQNGGECNP